MTAHRNYRDAVFSELAASRFNDYGDNFDFAQLGNAPPKSPSVWADAKVKAGARWAASRRIVDHLKSVGPLITAAAYYIAPRLYFARCHATDIERGAFLYDILEDEPSRSLLVKLIAYRILGFRKVKLPRNTREYWQDIKSIEDIRVDSPPLPINFMDLKLFLHDLTPIGYNFRALATNEGLACVVKQKQYEYRRGGVTCKAEGGDVVIDAGGCWGETSVYFAHEVGTGGAVVTLEFIPSNLAVLERNMALNPHLSGQMHVVRQPIWSESGRRLYYVDWGPGSRVTDDPKKYHSPDGITETITIDEIAAKLSLPKVDFIKMDIEGSELDALRGALGSLRAHRPKLAISLYHNPEDFETIPRYLASLNLGYRFYLDHHTIYQNETVLFAVPGAN